jgi:hypothetical protein
LWLFGVFFTVSVCWREKNLATLEQSYVGVKNDGSPDLFFFRRSTQLAGAAVGVPGTPQTGSNTFAKGIIAGGITGGIEIWYRGSI